MDVSAALKEFQDTRISEIRKEAAVSSSALLTEHDDKQTSNGDSDKNDKPPPPHSIGQESRTVVQPKPSHVQIIHNFEIWFRK